MLEKLRCQWRYERKQEKISSTHQVKQDIRTKKKGIGKRGAVNGKTNIKKASCSRIRSLTFLSHGDWQVERQKKGDQPVSQRVPRSEKHDITRNFEKKEFRPGEGVEYKRFREIRRPQSSFALHRSTFISSRLQISVVSDDAVAALHPT